MKKQIKIYVAGKISKQSVFGTSDWRDGFCKELSEKTGFGIINLDPVKSSDDFDVNENDPKLVYGRNAFMIKSADLVVVNLTDDISVGGSQEMLIAKYFKKTLVGIAQHGGKFSKDEKEVRGRIYKNWKEPFVLVVCDAVVSDINELAIWIKNEFPKHKKVKSLKCIDLSVKYYLDKFYSKDSFVKSVLKKK